MVVNPEFASSSLLNEHEAAAALGISARSLQRWRVRGLGPSFVKLGRGAKSAVRYSRLELQRFIAAGTVSSTAEQAHAKAKA